MTALPPSRAWPRLRSRGGSPRPARRQPTRWSQASSVGTSNPQSTMRCPLPFPGRRSTLPPRGAMCCSRTFRSAVSGRCRGYCWQSPAPRTARLPSPATRTKPTHSSGAADPPTACSRRSRAWASRAPRRQASPAPSCASWPGSSGWRGRRPSKPWPRTTCTRRLRTWPGTRRWSWITRRGVTRRRRPRCPGRSPCAWRRCCWRRRARSSRARRSPTDRSSSSTFS
mmetsp:Transcript_22872/g.54690  ORF Transcript_22872/g.54690 Transcript_22872/m.54690 type:complete len:226 (+) Transcript_22872:17-694(+)